MKSHMKSQKLTINSKKYLVVTMLILVVILMPLRLVEAQVIITALEPERTVNFEDIFELQLQIDTGQVAVEWIEAYLTFDPNVLEVQGEKPFTVGDFFKGGDEEFNRQDGSKLDYKIKISPAKKGSGTIASVTFKAISPATAGEPAITSPITVDFDVGRETMYINSAHEPGKPAVSEPAAIITARPPTLIQLIQPNGGEILKPKAQYNIVWISIGEYIDHVKIFSSIDGGAENLIVEKPYDPENPLYEWTIPDIESQNVKIKIIAYDSEDKNLAEDESDGTFEIRATDAVILKILDTKGYPGYPVTVPIELQNPEGLPIFSALLTFEYASDTPELLTNPVVSTSTKDCGLAQNPLPDNGVLISLPCAKPVTGSSILVEVLLDVKSGTKGGETATLSLSQAELNDGAISVETVPGDFEVYILDVIPKEVTLRVGETQEFSVINGIPPYEWSFISDVPCGEIDDEGEFTALGDWMAECTTFSPKGIVTVTDVTGRKSTAEVTVTSRYGDVDGSGEVDSEDAGVVIDSTVKFVTLSTCEHKAADVNCNRRVTPLDVSLIMQFVAKIIPELPVEPCIPNAPQSFVQAGEIWLGTFQEQSASIFTVPVLVKELDGLLSGRLVLSYNPQEVAFVEVEPTLLTKDYLFAHNAALGQLTVAFAGATQLEQDGELLHLNFKKISKISLRGIDSIVLSEAKLNDGSLRAVLHKVPHRQLPSRSELLPNFPNPFNPETWIPYQLAEAGRVTIKIYTLTGQLVRQFSLGHKEEGYYLTREQALHWNGKNQIGEPVGSGVYFYSIETPQFRAMKKMLLLK